MLVWVIWMARWNMASPDHGYCLGLAHSPDEARERGKAESINRGGKYEAQHAPCYVDDITVDGLEDTTIKPGSYYVASVGRHKSNGTRVEHLLGVYTRQDRAYAARDHLYPGWEMMISVEKID